MIDQEQAKKTERALLDEVDGLLTQLSSNLIGPAAIKIRFAERLEAWRLARRRADSAWRLEIALVDVVACLGAAPGQQVTVSTGRIATWRAALEKFRAEHPDQVQAPPPGAGVAAAAFARVVAERDAAVLALGAVKRHALDAKPEEVVRALQHIVRLCIDGTRGKAPAKEAART